MSDLSLSDFLWARLAEREKLALRCLDLGVTVPGYTLSGRIVPPFPEDGAAADLANCFDPRTVLREVEAMRRIVTYFAEEIAEATPQRRQRMTDMEFGRLLDAERTLGHLATIWADHEDYRAGWAPS
jgi:hypothetical protein